MTELPYKPEVWEKLSVLRKEVQLMGGKCTSLDEMLVKYQEMVYLNVYLHPVKALRAIQLRYKDGKWYVWKVIGRPGFRDPTPQGTLDEAIDEFWQVWRELHGQQER